VGKIVAKCGDIHRLYSRYSRWQEVLLDVTEVCFSIGDERCVRKKDRDPYIITFSLVVEWYIIYIHLD